MIFLSHASADADAVVTAFANEILYQGFHFSSKEIFYTSGKGSGFKPGHYIDGTILKALTDCKLTIILYSHQYMESTYCLGELGAIWATKEEDEIFPLILGDVEIAELPGMWQRSFFKKVTKESLLDLLDTVKDIFPENDIASPHYNDTADNFLKALPDRLKNLQPRATVKPAELEKAKKEKDEYAKAWKEAKDKINKQEKYIAEILLTKDRAETLAVDMAHNSAAKVYEDLKNELTAELRSLLTDTRRRMAHLIFNDMNDMQAMCDHAGPTEEIEDALLDKIFESNADGEVSFSRKTEGLKQAAEALRTFIKDAKYTDPAGNDYFADSNEHEALMENDEATLGLYPDMSDRKFWKSMW
jgi:hypothetical protein